jgi:hypothetical protein
MNLSRNNHYLPACYQQGFTDETGRVWFKAQNEAAERRRPRQIGKRRSLYIRNVDGVERDTIETLFGREVESRFSRLAMRIKHAREKFSNITAEEIVVLLRFIACKGVRTLAHWKCVDEQAGSPVGKSVFQDVMLRQMRQLTAFWAQAAPRLRFYTPLPYVGDHFISGDHPVVAIFVRKNELWLPDGNPEQRITQLHDLLANPKYEFSLPLSPYVCVSVHAADGELTLLPPETIDPSKVRFLNGLIRNQCNRFIIARDRASLS